MRRIVTLALVGMIATACSTAPPHTAREDAVMSGSETAEKAAKAAEEAEANDNTGIIVASSSDGASPEPETEPIDEAPEDPPPAPEDPEPPTITISIVKGKATLGGEPVPLKTLPSVFNDAIEETPDVTLVIEGDQATDRAVAAELSKAATEAGVKNIRMQWKDAAGEQVPPPAPPPKVAPPPKETKPTPAEKKEPVDGSDGEVPVVE